MLAATGAEVVMSQGSAPELSPHPLRLADAGDAKPAWITLLTTEHYNLQTQRATTVSEANGRASVFLGVLSAGLIALGFQGAGHGQSTGTMIFQILVLTSVLFLGLVAFARCLEVSVDDWEFAVRIARLRTTYVQLVPELAAVLGAVGGDEEFVVMLTGRWQPVQKMLSVAGSIAVLTSVVFGADLGGPPRVLWRRYLPRTYRHAASGCRCRQDCSNSSGGTSPHQEWSLTLLYQ
jgi:hypothetical protein